MCSCMTRRRWRHWRLAALLAHLALSLAGLATGADDCATLLEFRGSLASGADALEWEAGTDCCFWAHISCGATGNVVRMCVKEELGWAGRAGCSLHDVRTALLHSKGLLMGGGGLAAGRCFLVWFARQTVAVS